MKKKEEFFRPTPGKVFLTFGAMLFLPVVFVRYLAACPGGCETDFLARLAIHFESPDHFFRAAGSAYGLIGGAAMYCLACFFYEHRGKIHPHL